MININFLNTNIYQSQQALSIIIYSQINYKNNYILLLLGGIISSINPCFISVIPVIISYINKEKNNIHTGLIGGLLTSITLIIALITLLHRQYSHLINYIPSITSIGKILIGLNLLQIIYLPSITIKRSHVKLSQFEKEVSNYIVGLIIGISSLSCNTSITFTLGAIIDSLNNLTLSILYIIIYVFGYIAPIIILINMRFLYIEFTTINITFNIIMYIIGCFILGSGIFSLLENLFI